MGVGNFNRSVDTWVRWCGMLVALVTSGLLFAYNLVEVPVGRTRFLSLGMAFLALAVAGCLLYRLLRGVKRNRADAGWDEAGMEPGNLRPQPRSKRLDKGRERKT